MVIVGVCSCDRPMSLNDGVLRKVCMVEGGGYGWMLKELASLENGWSVTLSSKATVTSKSYIV